MEKPERSPDEIIRHFAELSLEKFENDTLNQLETMPEQELWQVMINTRYQEREIIKQSMELEKLLDDLEAKLGYLEEMEEYMKIVFYRRLQINTDTLRINFIEEDDVDGNSEIPD